jgi:molybdenum-dependent DNA-binding transcriptional regulator ModE
MKLSFKKIRKALQKQALKAAAKKLGISYEEAKELAKKAGKLI